MEEIIEHLLQLGQNTNFIHSFIHLLKLRWLTILYSFQVTAKWFSFIYVYFFPKTLILNGGVPKSLKTSIYDIGFQEMGIKFDTYWNDSLETFHYIKRGKSIRVWLIVSCFFFFFGKYFSSIITMHIESYWLGILKINTACHFMVISQEHELCSIVCPSPYKHLEKELFLLMSLVAYVQAKSCFVLWLSLNGWQIWEWNLTRCPALSKASFSSRTKYKSVILWIVMKLCTW